MVWECVSLPSPSSSHPSLPEIVSWVPLGANCTSALLTLFNAAYFLHLAMESLLCLSLGHFLGSLHRCECYVVLSMGWSELRIFVLCHLPNFSKPQLFKEKKKGKKKENKRKWKNEARKRRKEQKKEKSKNPKGQKPQQKQKEKLAKQTKTP